MTAEVHGYKVELLEELGRGAFGTVYKGYNPEDQTVAVKKVPKADRKKASTESMKNHLIKQKISHKQIIQVIDIKSLKDDMWIFMEYCDLGDLNHFFKQHNELDSSLDSKILLMKQIINGIDFLHSKDIVHRDIKPANILLKKGPDQGVVVKLGDFGLSKFLDPDGETSGMSSNVGTMIFKAPEFWERRPDGRIHYHRNVDVYAAGLTFVAMLQYQPERPLVPKVEGSLYRSEVAMPIGLTAFTRMVNTHPDVTITEIKSTDETKVKKIKEIIQGMTKVSPNQRPDSSAVKTRLQHLATMMSADLGDLFKLRRTFVPNSTTMTFVDDCLVVRGKPFGSRKKFQLNIYDAKTGQLRDDIQVKCNHWLSQGSLMRIVDGSGDSLIAEGCPQCEEVSVYDLNLMKRAMAFEEKKINRTCAGPSGTTFIWGPKKIEQHEFYGESMHSLRYLEKVWVQNLGDKVRSMCYDDQSDTIVFIAKCPQHDNELDIWGIKWSTGQLTWHHCKIIDFGVQPVRLDPRDVSSTPLGWVSVANGDNLLLLDPADGSVVNVLSYADLENIDEVVCRKDNTDKIQIAIRHGPGSPTRITSHILKCGTDEFGLNVENDVIQPKKSLLDMSRSLIYADTTERMSEAEYNDDIWYEDT